MRRGTTADRMEYVTWGDGGRSLLFLQGSPTSSVPSGVWASMRQRYFRPYLEAGYAVWIVTRPRGMPRGHSVADLADDYAGFIGEYLGGRVDLLLGESFGGMVAQYLAGRHPSSVGHLALVASGFEVSEWTKGVDRRLAEAVERRDRTATGAAFAEYLLPSPGLERLRRLGGPLMAKPLLGSPHYPPEDVVVEMEAEVACDARPVLPSITAPTVLVAGGRDRIFTRDIVEETAALIGGCRVVWLSGKGHVATCTSPKVAPEVLDFVAAQRRSPA
ncbi:alpha/beta hydrolase [Intrasporangium sp.]|uniref:alpha/beta fold hydrolase n=1 Tax=Intrasporangium sp. TaxID=1925024 RepID=UPI0033657FD2